MKHISPRDEFTDGIKELASYKAFNFMEKDKTLLVDLSTMRMYKTENNEKKLIELRDIIAKEYSALAVFIKANNATYNLNLSTYAQIAIEYLLDKPAYPQLLIMDLKNALDENIINPIDGVIRTNHLEQLYPNGFYNKQGYEKRLKEYKESNR